MAEMTIDQCQQIVDEWIKKYGVRYFNELTNLGILMEEVGEVARLMTRIYGEQSFKSSDEGKKLDEELGDVLFVLVCLANQCNINLTAAFLKSMEKKTHRDRERHLNNQKINSKTV
jgi:NTP pyrophosphatase (non-canonical NTP hydrolase)